MRYVAFCSCLAVLVACAKTDKQPAADVSAAPPVDTSMAAAAPAPAPAMAAPLALSDLAGKWAMRATTGGGDTTIVSFEMVATADKSGWTFSFPKRKPIPVRVVALEGDSIVTEAGPYESVLRKGVQVTTHNTMRLQDGKLVGTTVAHYKTTKPDSVVQLRVEGTRKQ
jgi:hypothetical protein